MCGPGCIVVSMCGVPGYTGERWMCVSMLSGASPESAVMTLYSALEFRLNKEHIVGETLKIIQNRG